MGAHPPLRCRTTKRAALCSADRRTDTDRCLSLAAPPPLLALGQIALSSSVILFNKYLFSKDGLDFPYVRPSLLRRAALAEGFELAAEGRGGTNRGLQRGLLASTTGRPSTDCAHPSPTQPIFLTTFHMTFAVSRPARSCLPGVRCERGARG